VPRIFGIMKAGGIVRNSECGNMRAVSVIGARQLDGWVTG